MKRVENFEFAFFLPATKPEELLLEYEIRIPKVAISNELPEKLFGILGTVPLSAREGFVCFAPVGGKVPLR